MADLRTLLAELGLHDAQTLLQSGNVVIRDEGRTPEELELLLEEESERRFKLRAEFFVRTLDEWNGILLVNPFPEAAEHDPSHLVVMFFKEPLDLEEVQKIQRAVAGPEIMQAVSRELFVVYPEGIGTSKLASTRGWSKFASRGTGRNWNTVLRLAALARAR